MRFENLSKNLLCSAKNSPTRIGFAGLAAVIAMLLLGAPVVSYGQDEVRSTIDDGTNPEQRAAVPIPPTLKRHILLPSKVTPNNLTSERVRQAIQATPRPEPRGVNTGGGVVYTCDANVPTSTCTYLNTTVAGYYNNVFTNANANIYVQFGATGLGESEGFYNFVHYTPYVTSLTNNTGKSSVQSQALTAINTYDTPAYGTQNLMEITVALGATLGFSGLAGINAAETTSCTPYTSGCYNEVVTVANASQQASEGFTLYYDDQGGSETASQYDFYAVVMHETDEVLGTSSCISTGSSTVSDGCDAPAPAGSNGVPSAVDLLRWSSPGHLALDTTPSSTAGQYFSFDGGAFYGAYGLAGTFKVYNTLANGEDFADYTSSSPDCGTNEAVQDAEGCPGEDSGLNIINDGASEITILNAIGFNIPEATMTSPTPATTLPGTSATFTWKAGTGATGYYLYVGTTGIGSSNIYASTTALTTTSQAVTGLPTSGTVNVRLWTEVGGYFNYVDYTYTGGTSAPAVTLTPTSLTFASTTVGSTTAAQTVTVKNTGAAALTLTSETLTGTNASSYLISANTCSSSLAAGASCVVSVEFKPTTTGTLTASLSVADNATGSPQAATLSGTGTSASAPAVTLTPTSLTFASTAVGSTTAAQTVTVKNSGTASLTLTSETLTGTNASSYLISANTCGSTLAASATCVVSVEFKPTTSGSLTASLSVADNASGSPQSASLSGTGTSGTSGTLTVSPTSFAFPKTGVSVTSAGTIVSLKNTGTSTVSISSLTFGGTNATSFKEVSTCPASLAAGVTCTMLVALDPTTTGSLSGTLLVTDNASGSPQSMTLTGTGVTEPALTLTSTSMAFGTVAHGNTSVGKGVRITNNGTASIILNSVAITGANPSEFVYLTTCETALDPTESCVAYVSFKPTAAGSFSGTLTFTDNGAGSPQTVTLTGTGS